MTSTGGSVMKRALLASAVLLALAAPASAQELGPCAERGQDAIVEFLALTPDQVAAWDQLLADRDAAAEPLRTELEAVETELRALLESPDPPADEVGALVIQGHDLRQQLGDVHRVYFDGFVALLDEEQAPRFEAVRRAERLQPLVPVFRAFGFLAPPPPPHP
jgi:Spy/CpxP family protein refolding chaperone